jgi:hypothetical protein
MLFLSLFCLGLACGNAFLSVEAQSSKIKGFKLDGDPELAQPLPFNDVIPNALQPKESAEDSATEFSGVASRDFPEDSSGDSSGAVFVNPEKNEAQPTRSGIFAQSADKYILPKNSYLRGSVSQSPERSPILQGSVQSLPEGTKVDLKLQCHLNSELSQKGAEVFAEVSRDVINPDGSKVLVPGKWLAHGFITNVEKEKRNGRSGSVEVQFDKIVSPDGEYEVPFDAKFSTADSKLKACAKVLARDIGYTGMGALAGGLMSFQLMGLPFTISTYGINIGAGAAIGGTIGLTSALVRKGGVKAVYPGDTIQLKIDEPISMPGFNQLNLPSAQPKPHIKGLSLRINAFSFRKDVRNSDKSARLLKINLAVDNYSKHALSMRHLKVMSALGKTYDLYFDSTAVDFAVRPQSVKTASLSFLVDSPKEKYDLILLNEKGEEVARSPIGAADD